MVKVYPKLKEYCQSIGYDFQVVDMRWGVRDEATADHMTSELCMKELKLCQDISTGPSFVVSKFHIYISIIANYTTAHLRWPSAIRILSKATIPISYFVYYSY